MDNTTPRPMTNPYLPPESRVADIGAAGTTEESPAIWNPAAAASWSLLFSPVFGAIVQMKNWKTLGQDDRAIKSRNWAIGTVGFFVMTALLDIVLPTSKVIDDVGQVLALILLVIWYYASGKPQQAYVLARFGKTYKRKGWSKPLLIAVVVFLAFIAVMGFIVSIATSHIATV